MSDPWPGWEKCETCGGSGLPQPFRPDVIDYEDLPKEHQVCPDCAHGYVPPAHQVEAAAEVFREADHKEPFASSYARFALIAAARKEQDV